MQTINKLTEENMELRKIIGDYEKKRKGFLQIIKNCFFKGKNKFQNLSHQKQLKRQSVCMAVQILLTSFENVVQLASQIF